MAANIFTGATSNDWGTATNWSLGIVPSLSDTHVATFNATSPNCTVNASPRVCNNIDFTNYLGTITMSQNLTVSSNVTLGASMGILGTGSLTVGASTSTSGTLTSNGKQWLRPLILGTPSAMSFTVVGDWYVTDLTCGNSGAATSTLNSTAGAKIYVSGNLGKTGTAPSMQGTTEIVLNGNGTWSNSTGNQTARYGNPVTIDTLGTITIGNLVTFAAVGGTGTLKHLNGTVTCSGIFYSYTATLDTNDSIPFSTLLLGSVTLASNATTSNLTSTAGPGGAAINGFRINITGNLTGTNITWSGTTKLVMTGTGTWSSSGTGYIGNDLEFNTTGIVTVTGNVYWGDTGATLLYTANAGTVNTGTSTLWLRNANQNINTDTLLWSNIVFSASTTTLQSNLRATGNVSQSGGNFTLNGISGSKLYVGGNFTLGTGTNTFSGSAEVVMNGTGTLSTLAGITTGRLQSNLTIDTAGAISISGLFPFAAATFKHLNGVFTPGTGTLWISFGGSATPTVLDLGGITIDNLRIDTSPSHTITLQSNLNLSGNFLLNSGSVTINGNTLAIGGNLTLNAATTNTVGGSTVILLNGTGTWSTSAQNVINTDLTINTTGIVSISGTVRYGTKTLLYVPNIGSVNTGSSTLSLESTCSVNVAGINWWNFTFGGGNTTTTITGDLNISNNLGTAGGNNSKTLNGAGNINVSGSFISAYRANLVKGTGGGYTLRMIGTGSIQDTEITGTGGSSAHYTLSGIPLVIDTVGTITFANTGAQVNPYFGIVNANVTHINGTVTVAPGHWFDVQGTVTLDVKGSITSPANLTNAVGINFNNFRVLGGNITLTSPICIIGLHYNNQIITINGSTVYNNGSLTTTSTISGTTVYRFVNTGTWSGSGYLNLNNVVIDTIGTLTISGTVYKSGGTLTYIPNTGSVNTGSSTLSLPSSCTLNVAGINWWNLAVIGTNTTITINSLLTVTSTMTIPSADTNFTGPAGFAVGTLSIPSVVTTATKNITLESGNTYTINNAFNASSEDSTFKYLIKSSTPGTRAILTLSPTASQDVLYVNATDIDSSLGQTIYSFNGVITNTLNWAELQPGSSTSGIFTFTC